MKLSTLSQVSALERQRALLIDQRDDGHLSAHLVGSMRLGGYRAQLGPEALERIRPVVVAYLDEQIAAVEQELRSYGIQVDL